MNRRIFIVILVIIITVIAVFYFSQKAASDKGNNGTRYSACYDENGQSLNCKKCDGKGDVFVYGDGYACEIRSKDALKKCLYDDECSKGCAYINGSAVEGQCRAYKTNPYDGLGLCGRGRGENIVNCNLNN